MNKEYDCIIVGAGISGISFAHYLHSIGKRVVILEKENRIGGQIETHYGEDDFWYELGAHTCYNSYIALLELAMSVRFPVMNKEAGSPKTNSYKLHTKKNTIGKIMTHIPYWSIMRRFHRLFTASKKNQSVRDYYVRLFGVKAYDRVFSKFFRAVLSQDPDHYPAELLMKRRAKRRKQHPRKLSFANGLSSLLRAITQFDGFDLKTGCEVVSADYLADRRIYAIRTSTNEVYYAASLAMAIPPFRAGALLAGHESALAQHLADVKPHYSATLSVMVEKQKVAHLPPMAGLITLTDDFLSATASDASAHPSLRAFAFHFEQKVGYTEQIETICRVLGINQADILELAATTHLLPSLKVSNLGMKQKVDASRVNNQLYLLGNYFDGVSIEDCVNRSHEEFERYHSLL